MDCVETWFLSKIWLMRGIISLVVALFHITIKSRIIMNVFPIDGMYN